MNAKPRTKAYGSLSIATNYYAQTELVTLVPPGCFIPQPKVGSAVIKLTRRNEPAVKVKNEALLFKIIRGAFAQRRKTLVNSLSNSNTTGFSKEGLIEALRSLEIDERIRGEALSLEDYARLSDKL